jgi:hypothetical protein
VRACDFSRGSPDGLPNNRTTRAKRAGAATRSVAPNPSVDASRYPSRSARYVHQPPGPPPSFSRRRESNSGRVLGPGPQFRRTSTQTAVISGESGARGRNVVAQRRFPRPPFTLGPDGVQVYHPGSGWGAGFSSWVRIFFLKRLNRHEFRTQGGLGALDPDPGLGPAERQTGCNNLGTMSVVGGHGPAVCGTLGSDAPQMWRRDCGRSQ